jgi:hypothetical protein
MDDQKLRRALLAIHAHAESALSHASYDSPERMTERMTEVRDQLGAVIKSLWTEAADESLAQSEQPLPNGPLLFIPMNRRTVEQDINLLTERVDSLEMQNLGPRLVSLERLVQEATAELRALNADVRAMAGRLTDLERGNSELAAQATPPLYDDLKRRVEYLERRASLHDKLLPLPTEHQLKELHDMAKEKHSHLVSDNDETDKTVEYTVDFCRVCPLRRSEMDSIEFDREDCANPSADVKMVNFCDHPEMDERRITMIDEIPDWCPLREAGHLLLSLPLKG